MPASADMDAPPKGETSAARRKETIMSTSVYSNGSPVAIPLPIHRPRRRPRVVEPVHSDWILAARALKATIHAARKNAGRRKATTADSLGFEIIDRIGELGPRDLHVLALTFSVLLRAGRG
jgi:hypothetical protein